MVVTTATAAFAAPDSPTYQPKYLQTTKADKVVVYTEKDAATNKDVTKATLVMVAPRNLKKSKLILGSAKAGVVSVENKDKTISKYEVTAIGPNALANSQAETIKLGAKVTKLDRRAFAGAKKLKKIVITSKSKVTVDAKAFNGISKKQLAKIKVRVSAGMSKEDFDALKAALNKAGITKVVQAAK